MQPVLLCDEASQDFSSAGSVDFLRFFGIFAEME